MSSFECQRCAACCLNNPVPSAVFYEDRERWRDRPDILEYFQQTNEMPCKFLQGNDCSIFDLRPVSCRSSHFSRHKGCPGAKDE